MTARRTVVFAVISSLIFLLIHYPLPLSSVPQGPVARDETIETGGAPGCYEQAQDGGRQIKKKPQLGTILAWVALIGGLAGVVYLVLSHKNPDYNVYGTWFFDHTRISGIEFQDWNVSFWGDAESGEFTDDFQDFGDYRVDGDNHLRAEYSLFAGWIYEGVVENNDRITGTYSYSSDGGGSGAFVATRVSPTPIPLPMSSAWRSPNPQKRR